MPRQFLQNPPCERVGLCGFRSTGDDTDILGRGINRSPQLVPDVMKTLPQLAFPLGLTDAMRQGIADGGLLLPETSRIKTAVTLIQKRGKLVGTVKSDGQRLQCAGKQGETLHRFAERLDARIGFREHGGSVFGVGFAERSAGGDDASGLGGEFVAAIVEALQVGNGLLEDFELAGNRIVILAAKATG